MKYMEPKVSIILLNWNGAKISFDCIITLIKKTSYSNYNIIFVDNGSHDDSVEVIQNNFPNVDIIKNKTNLGFPKGMNVGMRYAKDKYNPDYYLLLNNDLLFFEKKWLRELVFSFKNKKIGIANPVLLYPNKEIQRIGSKIKNDKDLIINSVTSIPEKINLEFRKKKLREIDLFLGACFLIKSDLIKEIGFLDERYSPYLIEDLEYSYRAKKAGYKIVTVTSSNVIHLFHETFNTQIIINKKKDIQRVYVVLRNSFLFSLDYLGWIKSFFLTLPLLFFTCLFEKKDKSRGNSFFNFKLRKFPLNRIINFFKSIKDGIRLYFKRRDDFIR